MIKEKPRVIKQIREKRIIIEARVASAAQPKVHWMKESVILREDSRHSVKVQEISKGEYEVALQIDRAEKSDKGSYKLVAKNEKGECTSPVVLVDVEGKRFFTMCNIRSSLKFYLTFCFRHGRERRKTRKARKAREAQS